MLAQEFRDQTVRRRPWEPVRIRMSDGTEIVVRHPEFIKVELGSFLVFKPTEEDDVFAGHTFYNLDHVLCVTEANQEQESDKR
jgi:hypothetical protein